MKTPKLRLHVGCGLVHRPGWINLDWHATGGADLEADAILLPFPDGSVEAIEARQLIEHLGYVGTVYALHEWARVLIPGGALLVETPDRLATLRIAANGETGDAGLPWIFGTEQRGQSHRYLFAAGELARLATQAGFEAVEVGSATMRPTRPVLRLTARRAADTPAIRLAVRLHRTFVTCGVLNPADAPQYLAALETVCEQASELVGTPGVGALTQLVSLSARYSPRVAACVLGVLPNPPAWPAAELAQARQLVADLERERFPARLACRWRTLPKLPGVTDAAWTMLEREISLYLAARLCPGEGLDDVQVAFDVTTAGFCSSDRAVGFFCREALTDLARRLTAQAVRAFARGDLESSAEAFNAALGYDPDLLWPRWNLARLYSCQGRRLDALAQYERLQANLPPGLRLAFEREMDAITGRDEGVDAFSVPVADLDDLLE